VPEQSTTADLVELTRLAFDAYPRRLLVANLRDRPLGCSGEVRLQYASVGTAVENLSVRITNYTDVDEARAAAERLAKDRG
jgi:hypothetical protein